MPIVASLARLCFVALALVAALALAGCNPAPVNQGPGEMSVPSDFSVQLRVHGKSGAADISEKTVDYVVEANHAFRVVDGAWGTQGRVFPPILRYLTYKEFESLYLIVAASNLTVEPSSPNAEAAVKSKSRDTVFYEVQLATNGHIHTYFTTSQESPPTAQLLVRLHELRTGRRIGTGPATQPAR